MTDGEIVRLLTQIRNSAQILNALGGDIFLSITPTTKSTSAITGAWTRTVTLKVVNYVGDVIEAYSGTHTTSAAIADTSALGTATIPSTTITFVKGVATITITGSAHAWVAAETDTLTISNLTIFGKTVTGGTSVETFV